MDPRTSDVLQDILRREGRSVLMYVGDAFPWTTVGHSADLARLRELIHTEGAAIGDIVKYLQRQHVPAAVHGSYPASFTTINFLALKYILPRLIAYERESIPALERELASIADPAARQVGDGLLKAKLRNLALLEELAARQSQPAA